jgi:hypothetical protein
MDARHLIAAAAIAGSTLTFGVGVVSAAPLDPAPPCPTCDGPAAAPTPPLKAMKCWPYGRVGPGSARGGGGVPVYPPPCPPGTPH